MSFKNKNFVLMLAITIVGMMVTLINQSVINVALPSIMTSLNIKASTAQWLATAYLLVGGILVPVSAYLIQRFSYRKLFLSSMAFFLAGSLICAISGSFPVLLSGRIFQAIGCGILMPLGTNIFLLSFPVEKRGTAMGLLGLGLILAPALGPTVGGYVLQYYSWNILFYAMSVISIAVILFAAFKFSFESTSQNVKLDFIGVVLSTIGFATLLYGVSEISSKGWKNAEVISFIAISVVTLAAFVLHLLKKENPLLELRVFKDFNFSYTAIVNIIMQVALYGGMLMLPIYMQNVRGYTPLESGLALLPGSLILGLMGVFTGKLFDKVGIKPLAFIGLTIMTIVTYMLSKLSLETSYTEIVLLYSIRAIGMAFVIMPITSAGLITLPKELLTHANALQNTLKQVASSIGTAILIVVMTDQTKSYITELGASANADSKVLAAIHGIDAAFLVATCIGCVAVIMSFFFRSKKRIDAEKNAFIIETMDTDLIDVVEG